MAAIDTVDERRRELGEFLRSRAARGSRRRCSAWRTAAAAARPGLRREEVASDAGVGLTWYTWLEQGRAINASAQVLAAVARTLRLDRFERAHLFALAAVPDPDLPTAPEEVPASVRALLAQLDPLPAHVATARYDVLAWNDGYAAVMGDLSTLPCDRRNALLLLFFEPAWRAMLLDRPRDLGHLVAQFRANMASHVGEPAWTSLVAELEALGGVPRALGRGTRWAARPPSASATCTPVGGLIELRVDEPLARRPAGRAPRRRRAGGRGGPRGARAARRGAAVAAVVQRRARRHRRRLSYAYGPMTAGAPCSTSGAGTATDRSSRWCVSSTAMTVRDDVAAVPFSVCRTRGAPSLRAHATAEAPRLVVRRVGAARQLAVAALARQPDLDVVLLRRRGTEVAGRDVRDAVVQAERLRDLLLDREQPVVLLPRAVGMAEREHLDLVELVRAEDAARVLARRAGLAPEARRDAAVAERQVLLGQDLAEVEGRERDLARCRRGRGRPPAPCRSAARRRAGSRCRRGRLLAHEHRRHRRA